MYVILTYNSYSIWSCAYADIIYSLLNDLLDNRVLLLVINLYIYT
jgi:hypothetical protein